jgi:hypothetical protein
MFEAASAPLSYSLEPQKLTDGVWMLAGANEPITRTNGGAMSRRKVKRACRRYNHGFDPTFSSIA